MAVDCDAQPMTGLEPHGRGVERHLGIAGSVSSVSSFAGTQTSAARRVPSRMVTYFEVFRAWPALYDRAITCVAGAALAPWSFWLRAQATVCRIASRSGVTSSLNAAA